MTHPWHTTQFRRNILTKINNENNRIEGVKEIFYTPLAGERLRPLGHLSVSALIGANALLIKRFFTWATENAKIHICYFLQVKPERLVNWLAQTAQIWHTDVLRTFR